jgi:hypothetical protein
MDCAQIRDAFVGGKVLPIEAVRAHLEVCPHCRELFARDAELGRSLASEASLAVPFPDAMFEQLEARVAGETGPRAWLRSRPTNLRGMFVVLGVLLVVLFGGIAKQRPDFADYPTTRVALVLVLYFVAIVVAAAKELTLAPRRGGFADNPLLLSGGLGLPFLVAFLPATEASRHFGPEGALGCFVYGAVLTVPVALLLWAFDRDDEPSLRSVGLSAVALGLSANLVLELHCPSGNALHLLLGHASIGIAWLGAWFVARRFSRAQG